jgi:predicted dehydrogenase
MAPELDLAALCRRAEELGLTPGDILLFRLPPHALWGLATYGLFGRYRHWSRGKAYQRLRLQGELGLQRIYELIVHTEPPQAFVLSGNRPIEDVLVTEAHHPYHRYWWPFGHISGWEHLHANLIHHFVEAVANDRPISPDGATFEDGYKAAVISEAIEESSRTGKWIAITY